MKSVEDAIDVSLQRLGMKGSGSRFVAMRNHGPCVLLGGVTRWVEEIEISLHRQHEQ